MISDSDNYSWFKRILPLPIVLSGLFIVSRYNYLLFHVLVEFFSISVSCGIFFLAWNSRRINEKNSYLLFLGISYLFVAGVDLFHTLSYEGMNLFQEYSADPPTQLWVAGRGLQALSLLAAPALINRRLNHRLVAAFYLVVTALIFSAIMLWGSFPACYVQGLGLTGFKIICEYLIVLVLAGSVYFHYRKRKSFDPVIVRLIIASIAVLIAAETAFAFHAKDYGALNLAAHLLKVISVYLLYLAILDLGLNRPYSLLFKHIKDSEERTRLTFNAISDAVFLHPLLEEGFGKFVDVNDTACRRYGYSREELLALSAPDITKKADAQDHARASHRRSLDESGQMIFEATHVTKSGEEFPVEINSVIFRQGGIPLILAVVRDITQRKKVEASLRRNETTLNSFIDNIPGRAFLKNESGQYILVNRKYLDDLGLTSLDQVRGKDDHDLFDRETANVFVTNDYRVRRTGRPVTFEESLEIQGRTRFYLVVKFPIESNGSGSSLIGGVAIDVTEQKQAEQDREDLSAQLRQAQKMEALGTLAGGIAHDFNNILAAIIGYGELALEDAVREVGNERKIREIIKAGNRAKDLVTQILTFSRKLKPELKPLDLNKVVIQTLGILERTIPRMIEMELNLADDLWLVNADPSQLSQVFMNLGSNSKDAMPEGGRLIFETENVTLGEDYCGQHAEAEAGDYVLLTVSDTGQGMDRKTQENIFDPFFTSKEVGKGTGLGLATVYGIVKNHRGHIMCYSEPGQGTTFRIYLPAIRAQIAGERIESRDKKPLAGNETILLVDDERSLLDMGRQILSRQGYTVHQASTGEEALEKYGALKTIDLIILDVSMPGMGGHKCLERLLELNPEARVIIASGYSLNGQLKDIMASGASGFVAKPFSKTDLLRSVRQVLDDQPA